MPLLRSGRILRSALSYSTCWRYSESASRTSTGRLESMRRLDSIPVALPDNAGFDCGVCLDKGYDYSEVYELLAEFGFTAHVRSRRQEADAIKHEAGFRARRWVVERTHSWLNRFRRLLIRWEKRARTYIAMLHLACGLITWREAL